jgi:hypothetical protein
VDSTGIVEYKAKFLELSELELNNLHKTKIPRRTIKKGIAMKLSLLKIRFPEIDRAGFSLAK